MNDRPEGPGPADPADELIVSASHATPPATTPASRPKKWRRRQRRHADRFLVEAANLLASSLDFEETLAAVARLAVRSLADLCAIDIVEDGEIRRVQVAHAAPGQAELMDQLLRLPIDRHRPHLTLTALETGQSVLIRDVTPEVIEAISLTPERRRILEALRPRSIMAVPMVARGRNVGVILLGASGRRFGPDDLTLAERLASIAGLEVDNARHFRAARQALQARDRVLGVVAHDLRNPLNTILMSADLLRDHPHGQDDLERRVDVIIRSARRMDRLIQDLLDVARLEADRLLLDPQDLTAETIAREALDLSASRAAAKSLQLRLDAPAGGNTRVAGDRDRLLQVLINLIDNAIQFTPEGGSVEVCVEELEAGVRFAVCDTGVGIEADDLPHLFDAFWQARRTSHQGTGLGLAICRGIVEAHGGSITATSVPGKGSTFEFTLPKGPRDTPGRSAGTRANDEGTVMTNTTTYHFGTSLALPYEAAVARVREALVAEGFGILTEIDVRATLGQKLGIDFRPYVILGACNPPLAHRALSEEPEIGVLLPCNVVVYAAEEEGRSVVSIMDPEAALSLSGSAAIRPVAAEVKARMQRVLAALGE